MAKMSWNVNVQITGAPVVTAGSAAQPVEATDRLEVEIAAGDSDKVVDLQPGGAAALQLLMIKSSVYGSDLSYKASDGGSDSAAVVIDGPQVFTGGSVALFGVAPNQLKFSNSSTDTPARIEILVARDATP